VPMQSQEIICGGRYLSSDEPMRVFAAGATTNELRIEVLWRSGKESIVRAAKANHVYEIEEPTEKSVARTVPKSSAKPLFLDVSSQLKHVHHEDDFDDFALQLL